MTATGDHRVWDLADSSAGRRVKPRGLDLGGPIAVVLAAVAIIAALAPGVPILTRWCMVVSFGGIGGLVGFSSLRHRQTLASLLVGVVGVVLPIGAVLLATSVCASTYAPVSSRTVSDAMLGDSLGVVAATPAFSALPETQQADASAAITRIVTRLRVLHGSFGPFPTALAMSDGSIVEGTGAFRGTSLGLLPDGEHLEYSVTASGTVFRITLVADSTPTATISAGSTLVIPDAG